MKFQQFRNTIHEARDALLAPFRRDPLLDRAKQRAAEIKGIVRRELGWLSLVNIRIHTRLMPPENPDRIDVVVCRQMFGSYEFKGKVVVPIDRPENIELYGLLEKDKPRMEAIARVLEARLGYGRLEVKQALVLW